MAFDFPSSPGEYLIIKEGNLIEVSVVTFPAQPEATMSFIVVRSLAQKMDAKHASNLPGHVIKR